MVVLVMQEMSIPLVVIPLKTTFVPYEPVIFMICSARKQDLIDENNKNHIDEQMLLNITMRIKPKN